MNTPFTCSRCGKQAWVVGLDWRYPGTHQTLCPRCAGLPAPPPVEPEPISKDFDPSFDYSPYLSYYEELIADGEIECMGPQDWDERMYQLASRDGVTISCGHTYWSNMWNFADWYARVLP